MASILIVESERTAAARLAGCLRDAGHLPIVARTGWAALRAARRRPELILLDLGFPDPAAPELLRRLRRRPETARTPVVAVSASAMPAGELVGLGPHAVAAILRKPATAAEIRAVVAALLRLPVGWPQWPPAAETRLRLLYRLILEGSNALVRWVCLRLDAERGRLDRRQAGAAPDWAEIARRGCREGLLTRAERDLLAGLEGERDRTEAAGAAD